MTAYRKSRKKSPSPLDDPKIVAFIAFALAMIFGDWVLRLAVLGGGIVVFAIGYAIYYERLLKLKATGIDEIDKMEGVDFEKRLRVLFIDLGYSVKTTPIKGDYGADLVITKNGITTVVQAKRSSTNVGVSSVQEVIPAIGYYECKNAMVVTNMYFTGPAHKLAQKHGVEMWERPKLIQKLEEVLT